MRGRWIIESLKRLEKTLFQESQFAIGLSFSLADIYVASIYKKALQHGSEEYIAFTSHLNWLRTQEAILRAEPKT